MKVRGCFWPSRCCDLRLGRRFLARATALQASRKRLCDLTERNAALSSLASSRRQRQSAKASRALSMHWASGGDHGCSSDISPSVTNVWRIGRNGEAVRVGGGGAKELQDHGERLGMRHPV